MEEEITPQRRVEVQRGEEWIAVSMGDLVVGDRFRMFESDGTPADDGGEVSIVAAPPKPREGHPGRWSVAVESVEKAAG